MSFLTKTAATIAGRTVVNVARRIAREAKIRRKAEREGYQRGYADAKAGKPNKHQK